jgi:hypothetical protein
MDLNTSYEAASRLATQDFPNIVCKAKVLQEFFTCPYQEVYGYIGETYCFHVHGLKI